jgi:putative chitinase
MPGVDAADASAWVVALNTACTKYEIVRSLRRMAAFLGHIAHESGSLRHLKENLNYTDAHRINKIFGAIKTDEEAEAYVRNAEALANKVYANRNGNGDTASGDGWRYRGRGLIQLTGKANYAAFARDTHVDVVNDPDLVATPRYAALSAAWYWKKHRLNELSDAQMYQAVSKGINKSLDSFPAREAKRRCALNALRRALAANLAVPMLQWGFWGLH